MHDPIEPRIPRDVLVSSPVSPTTNSALPAGFRGNQLQEGTLGGQIVGLAGPRVAEARGRA